jgi:hypothetical protein
MVCTSGKPVLPIALVAASILTAPLPLAQATDGGAVLSTVQQWQIILASPRLKLDGDLGSATAVVVGQRDGFTYLLTADHAVREPGDVEVQFFTRRSYPVPSQTVKGTATVVDSKAADFALIRIVTPTHPPVVRQAVRLFSCLPLPEVVMPMVKLPKPNLRPKRFPFDAVSVGCTGGAAPSASGESILAKRFTRDEKSDLPGAFAWEASRAQQSGRSGGALVLADGTLIGICRARSADRGYYTHLDEIQAVLKEKGYAFLWSD